MVPDNREHVEMIEMGKCRKEIAQQMEYQYFKSKTYQLSKGDLSPGSKYLMSAA